MRTHMAAQLILLLFAALLRPMAVLAHGSGPALIVEERQAGPYLLSVYGDLDVGEGFLFIDALVNGQPPPAETAVNVRATAPGGAEPLNVRAEPQNAGASSLYVATLPFTAEGAWHFEIAIEGAAGSGRLPFEAEVIRPPPAWTSLIPAVGIGIALVVFFIVTLKRQREIE